MIPVSQRTQIFNEVNACIVKEGIDTERCIIQAAKNHSESTEQAREMADEIAEELLDAEDE